MTPSPQPPRGQPAYWDKHRPRQYPAPVRPISPLETAAYWLVIAVAFVFWLAVLALVAVGLSRLASDLLR